MGTSSTLTTAVATIVKTAANFDSTNVTVANYTVLDAGVTRAAIIERRAPFRHGPAGGHMAMFGAYSSTHEYTISVFRKYVADGTTYTNLLDDADAIVAQFDKYPTLNGVSGVGVAYISEGGEIFEIMDTGGTGPYFLMQTLVCAIELTIDRASSE